MDLGGMTPSRRDFVATLGAAALGSIGVDLRSRRSAKFRLGYASITWAGNDRQAIDDIASLGFAGIQLRANVIPQFKATELRELLRSRQLSLVALSSGAVRLGPPESDQQMIDEHVARARYLRDAGGGFLQVTDEKPAGRSVTADDILRLGRLLTEIGKRTADVGVALGYHNHMGTIGERPSDVDRILDAADHRYVGFELDIAHYHQGGGDPVEAIRRHAGRLLFLHLKDVQATPTGYRFVALGQGTVNVRGVVVALREIGFEGWAVIELDSVPPSTPQRTPKQCAEISLKYMESLR